MAIKPTGNLYDISLYRGTKAGAMSVLVDSCIIDPANLRYNNLSDANTSNVSANATQPEGRQELHCEALGQSLVQGAITSFANYFHPMNPEIAQQPHARTAYVLAVAHVNGIEGEDIPMSIAMIMNTYNLDEITEPNPELVKEYIAAINSARKENPRLDTTDHVALYDATKPFVDAKMATQGVMAQMPDSNITVTDPPPTHIANANKPKAGLQIG